MHPCYTPLEGDAYFPRFVATTPCVLRHPLTQPCAVLASSWELRALKAEESARQHLVALIALTTGDGEAPGPESAETGSASRIEGAAQCRAVVEALRRELSAAQDELDLERERAVKLHSRLVSLEEHMVSHQIHCTMFSVACSL